MSLIRRMMLIDEFGNFVTSEVNPAIVSMENEHEKTHDGLFFEVCLYSTIAGNGMINCQLKTGAKKVHLKQQEFMSDDHSLLCTFIEAPTLINGTAVVPAINRNRTSANTPALTVYSNPTGISGGLVITRDYYPAAAKNPGGAVNTITEWVLAPNTSYVHQLTNLDNTASTFLAKFFFYEI